MARSGRIWRLQRCAPRNIFAASKMIGERHSFDGGRPKTDCATMSIKLTEFVTVFRTGQIIHLDWAANALEEANIPFQRREETAGGLRLAMPASPTSGLGQEWSIVVPESYVGQAREILVGLPIAQNTTTDAGGMAPSPKVGVGRQIIGWIIAGAIILSLIQWGMNAFRH